MEGLDAESLLYGFKKSKKDSIWKCSVQKFEIYQLRNCVKLANSISDGTYVQKPFREFVQNERGKIRPIRSLHINDRIIQRVLCDKVLIPNLAPDLIYDNGASLGGKGIDFCRNRLLCHLQKFYRKYGNTGYILQVDFSKFFDNIPHNKILDSLNKKKRLKPYLSLLESMIDAFKYDVSYGFNENFPFDSMSHRNLIKEGALQNGTLFLKRSLGIGSQISQILGLWYPRRIDSFCKNVLSLKYYGRYMDDIYIIHQDKEFLKKIVLPQIQDKVKKLGLFLNPQKVKIIPLRRGFSFLKIFYKISNSGKIFKRLSNKTFSRTKKKLKKLKRMVDLKILNIDSILRSFKSWVGNVKKYKCYFKISKILSYFKNLFGGILYA